MHSGHQVAWFGGVILSVVLAAFSFLFSYLLSDFPTGSVSYPIPFSKILAYLNQHRWVLFFTAKNPD